MNKGREMKRKPIPKQLIKEAEAQIEWWGHLVENNPEAESLPSIARDTQQGIRKYIYNLRKYHS